MIKHFYTCITLCFFSIVCSHALAQTNVALGKTVTATGGSNLPNLVNGDFNDGASSAITGNAAAPPNAEWFQIDLGADYFIDSIVLVANSTTTTTENLSRRFMIATWSSELTFISPQPTAYIGQSMINRLIYSAPIGTGSLPFGVTGTMPQAAGVNLGPAFPIEGSNRVLRLNIGIHKARYVRILTIQDEALTFGEVEVYTTQKEPIRFFQNGDFEIGSVITTGVQFIGEGNVLGWSTTEPVGMWNTSTAIPERGTMIEFWRGGSNIAGNVPAYSNNYFIELNAHSSGMLVQEPICLLPGETFTWSFAHRGRSGVDRMALAINYVDVALFDNSHEVSGTHQIVPGSVLPGTTAVKGVTNADGWTHYSGTWTNPSSSNSNVVTFGFRAVSTSSGNLSTGNFLDDIQIRTSSSVASFDSASKEGAENIPTANLPKLQLNGNVNTPGTIELHFVGGTATRGVDYITFPATGAITIPIPVGNYDGTDATAIDLSPYMQIQNDTEVEGSETIIMELLNPTGNIIAPNASAGFCQTTNEQIIYTIIDYIALPVSMGPLMASVQNDFTVNLSWKTFSEQNSVGFDVERSSDGVFWTRLGFVSSHTADGHSSSPLHYQWSDQYPLAGINYYRLKQKDQDEKHTYSNAVKVTVKNNKFITVFPNPVTHTLNLLSELPNDITEIKIIDFTGKAILTFNSFKKEIDIHSFPPGIYVVKVRSKNKGVNLIKVIKN